MSYKIAGIDVHKKVLMVVVIDASTPEGKPERRRFATMPSELRRLSSCLREQEVKEAVMESTAQYWRSVWLELEPYMRLQLAQAFQSRPARAQARLQGRRTVGTAADGRRVDLEFCPGWGTA
jgi:hypothetical protein